MFGRKGRLFRRRRVSRPVFNANDELTAPHSEFDERLYLEHNPDVAAWVRANPGATGWRYFVEQGYLENRTGVSQAICLEVRRLKTHEIDEGLPPAYLRQRVHGTADVGSFETVGRVIAASIFDHLARAEKPRSEFRVLDLGVGCGRILKPLEELSRKSSSSHATTGWYGSDIDQQAIEWCRSYLGAIGKFVVNDMAPPLPFPDRFFHFVYCISIFTHLPEDLQFAWLKEINRILQPSGKALLSTLPLGAMSARDAAKLAARGFRHPVGKGTHGLPKAYQDSYHSRDYIELEWPKRIAIESFHEKGVNNQQDLIVCRPLA